MAHHTVRSGYRSLVERLNRFPQGAPPSEVLYRILGLLFSEREAALVALLPIKPFTAADAAAAWKMPEAEARRGNSTRSPTGRSCSTWRTTGARPTPCRRRWPVSSSSR